MNHTKRLLRIAEKILADVHFRTQQEFDEYLKNHPNYREDTKFFVNGVQVKAPPKQKKNDDRMTEEQKMLDRLSVSKNADLRFDVARDQNTHPKTLEKLSEDKEHFVRAEVAYNPNTPSETLDKLSRDKNEYVREGVALNENATQEILDILSIDKNEYVRKFAKENLSRRTQKQ